MIFQKLKKQESGFIFLLILITTGFFLLYFGSMATLALTQQKLYKQEVAKQQALDMAEAGVNYYTWHLAHDFDDYYDGTGSDPGETGSPYGPYEHSYDIPNSDLVGYFSLEIYPPETGSTIVTIKSTGWISSHPNIKKIVEVDYGMLSLGSYSFLTNSDVWFGEGEYTDGVIHSNGGVRMDGLNDSLVTSARDEYVCYSVHGCSEEECEMPCEWREDNCYCPGVWGIGAGSSLWSYPVSSIDFDSITLDIADMRSEAETNGVALAQSSDGYHVVFKSDGTFDVYKIKNLQPKIWQRNDDWNGWVKVSEEIKQENFSANYSIPDNGLIFAESDVWVEGVVNGRVTLVSAVLPDNENTRTTIYINDNLVYTDRDGSNILGLIAQKDIKVPRHAPTDLTIDAMLLAQHGRVFRNYYGYHAVKNNIEVYGSIITNRIWTWKWGSAGLTVDGYTTNDAIFDSQVIENPPPFFPTLGSYEFISWSGN